MTYLTLTNVDKSYYGVTILTNINITLNEGDKIAIVGRNGAGKSTLAQIIVGEEPYDSGYVSKVKGVKLGYFSQQRFIDTDQTVYEALLTVFERELSIEHELKQLYEDYLQTYDEELLERHNQLLIQFEEIGGYTFRARTEAMLNRFGFKDFYQHRVKTLSGGEKTRLALAKLLLEEPDVLVLDEPTNHLDLETIEYLENFLRAYKKSVILISHDRYFLNQIVNQVFEIELKKGTLYHGNYDDYLAQKEAQYEQQLKQFEQQQKLIQKEKEFIERNIARASTTKRAQSRLKKLEKMEIMDIPRIDERKMNLTFKLEKTSGKIVLLVKQLEIGYEKPLLRPISFEIRKGDKIGLIGANGTGKSTLLRTIEGMIPAINGEIEFGTGVIKAYFDQENARINSNKTVLDEIWDEHRTMLEKDVRGLLARFLFTGEDVFKIVNELSGGEKVRLALVKLFLKKANFLILDEITNNLDIVTKELLEKALIDYEGTILFVSHDRYFINRVASKIMDIENKRLYEYNGNYDYYLFKKREQQEKSSTKQETTTQTNDYEVAKQRRNYIQKLKREQEELERDIEAIDEKLDQLKQEQFKEEVYLDPEKSLNVQNDIYETERRQQELLERWAEISEQLESEITE